MPNREPRRNDGRDDDTRRQQYEGRDPSGYLQPPRATEGYESNGQWHEPSPGNYGEAGGRWHDHEGPYAGERMAQANSSGQPRAGFKNRATGLWSGGPGGTFGYGNFGREGAAPEAGKPGAALGASKPQESHAGKGPRGYARSDARIHEDVCDRLTEHDEIDARGITVTVREAEVTLEGEVESRSLKRAIEDVAATTRGVHDVLNKIRVKRAGAGEADERPRAESREKSGNGDTSGGTKRHD